MIPRLRRRFTALFFGNSPAAMGGGGVSTAGQPIGLLLVLTKAS